VGRRKNGDVDWEDRGMTFCDYGMLRVEVVG
jgi:hypothetical protein